LPRWPASALPDVPTAGIDEVLERVYRHRSEPGVGGHRDRAGACALHAAQLRHLATGAANSGIDAGRLHRSRATVRPSPSDAGPGSEPRERHRDPAADYRRARWNRARPGNDRRCHAPAGSSPASTMRPDKSSTSVTSTRTGGPSPRRRPERSGRLRGASSRTDVHRTRSGSLTTLSSGPPPHRRG
jgi:hypothetical protein